MKFFRTEAYKAISEAWEDLSDEHKVQLLILLYGELTDAQKDEFLRETGNP